MSLHCYEVSEDKKSYGNHIIKNINNSREETVNASNNKVL